MLIEFVSTSGPVSFDAPSGYKKAIGGATTNVAVGISKLGGSSAFISKVYIYVYLMTLLFGFLLLSTGLPCLICFIKKSMMCWVI
jgi:hypothetical protein